MRTVGNSVAITAPGFVLLLRITAVRSIADQPSHGAPVFNSPAAAYLRAGGSRGSCCAVGGCAAVAQSGPVHRKWPAKSRHHCRPRRGFDGTSGPRGGTVPRKCRTKNSAHRGG